MRLAVTTGQTAASVARASHSSNPPCWRRRRAWLTWTGLFVAAAMALTWCYVLQSRTIPANADGAGQVLQGHDMLHGNLLLSGWTMSDVSFYTVEVPIDALLVALHGFGPDVVHVTAALLYTLLVVLSGLVARGTARGRAGMVRALLAALILLAPGLSTGTRVLLLQPDHTGTGVPLLVALLYLDRARERWWTPVVLCVLLVWAQVSDQLALLAGAVPVVAVCLARAASGLVRRTGQWRYDALLALAGVTSAALTKLAQAAITTAGGYVLRPLPDGWQLARLGAVPRQVLWTVQNALLLFGADWFHQAPGVPRDMALAHLAGALLALAGLLLGVVAVFRRGDRVTLWLATGTVLVLVAAAFGNFSGPVQGAHEMAVVLPFGAVLAGRMLGPRLASCGARVTRHAAAAGLALLAACYLAAVGYNASQTSAPIAEQPLANFLRAQHLTSGISRYWAANITTLASGGHVRVAPVAGYYLRPRVWEARASWFDPAVSAANFAVTSVSGATPTGRQNWLSPDGLRAQFGPPAHVYYVGTFKVLTWNYNILTRLAPRGGGPGTSRPARRSVG